ncbi:hypothetical protein EG68_10747 [Paragonimus skrjabini miyazakii]|uniref:Uncharacterized protein n=1 Tax=Paragonimus skrjabini miyazakii TaxID=59628 RepID=A0A8S9YFS4_9TREM|nr:hypothetical protein EG68_10747 [Paragonimus skrjabini miyazakii]
MESSPATKSVLYGGCSGIFLGCCDFLYRSDPKRGVLVGLVTAFTMGYITNLVYRMKTLKISGGSPISYWDYKKSIDRMLSERRCT